MKLTSKQLRKIVNEEVSRLREGRGSRNPGHAAMIANGELNDVSLDALLAFADAYADLGDAVCEQVQDLSGDPDAGCNPNAVKMIARALGGCNVELDDAIAEWEEHNSGDEDFDEDAPAPEID